MAEPKYAVGQRVAPTINAKPLGEGYVREAIPHLEAHAYRVALDDAPQHQRWRWMREEMLSPAATTAPVYRKCSDLPDVVFLRAIDEACEWQRKANRASATAAMRWNVSAVLAGRADMLGSLGADEWPGVPEKIVSAKIYRLDRRGLIHGCRCGCRGDLEVTAKGRAFQREAREAECDRGLPKAFYGYAREIVKVGLDAPSPFPGVEAARKDVLDAFGIPNTLRAGWAEIDRESVRRNLPVPEPCREIAGTFIHRQPHTCPKWARG